MKTLLLAVVWLLVSAAALAQAVSQNPAPAAPDLLQPSITLTPPSPRERAWAKVLTAIAAPGGGAATPADALSTADVAKSFYKQFPQDPNAIEARKLEALFLIYAADGGDTDVQARMLSTVQDFRADKSVPAYQRASVAGTYEFKTARPRIKTRADLQREHEAVARGLMKDFPEQPQGYVSLLTVAMRSDDGATARSLAQEVATAEAAPAEARLPAQHFVTRLDLVGQPVARVFGGRPLGPTGNAGWPKNEPGLIYVWATWSPDSVALAEKLAGLKLPRLNVVGICLDDDPTPALASAAAHNLLGRIIYGTKGVKNDLAEQLGADEAPLVYLVDANGKITDVRGLDDLDPKLATLGQ